MLRDALQQIDSGVLVLLQKPSSAGRTPSLTIGMDQIQSWCGEEDIFVFSLEMLIVLGGSWNGSPTATSWGWSQMAFGPTGRGK